MVIIFHGGYFDVLIITENLWHIDEKINTTHANSITRL